MTPRKLLLTAAFITAFFLASCVPLYAAAYRDTRIQGVRVPAEAWQRAARAHNPGGAR